MYPTNQLLILATIITIALAARVHYKVPYMTINGGTIVASRTGLIRNEDVPFVVDRMQHWSPRAYAAVALENGDMIMRYRRVASSHAQAVNISMLMEIFLAQRLRDR